MRYIELNPVCAAMVSHPGEYRWSSYRANGQGDEDRLISPHPCHMSLAVEATDRCAAYRELFRHELDTGFVDEIRKATNGNFALGDHRFAAASAAAIGRRVPPGKSGRPRKAPEPVSGRLFE